MKKFSELTIDFKLWMARTFGIKVRIRGMVNNYNLSFGGAGNQWTIIDFRTYGTYWDFNTKDWHIGDEVTFTAFYEPFPGRKDVVLQAENLKKVRNNGPEEYVTDPLFV